MLRSTTYFAAGRRIVRAGDLVPENDPIVKGRESLFAVVPGTTKARAKAKTTEDDTSDDE